MGNNKVIIIDYNLGNLFSVKHACTHVGLIPIVTSEKEIIIDANAIILPGVGSFGNAMKNLEKLDLISPLRDQVAKGVPLFGICLGLQLLFTESEEFGNNKGLDIIQGIVTRFPTSHHEKPIKIPQIGWNKIFKSKTSIWQGSALEGVNQDDLFYFVHSFYAKPDDDNDVFAITDYEGVEYCSSISKGNIFATQFHPEKSSLMGIEIYRNWVKNVIRSRD